MSTNERPTVRERLLSTADRLFYAEGIHAVGIDRILAEAKVAKASLYGHFGSKDALVEAYLDGRSTGWRAYVEAELPGRADDPIGHVLAVFDLLGEWFTDPGYRGCPFINVGAECGTTGPVASVLDRHRTWVRELFTGLLEEAGFAERRAMARRLVLLYDGAMVAAQLDGDPTSAVDAREAARQVVTCSTEDDRPTPRSPTSAPVASPSTHGS